MNKEWLVTLSKDLGICSLLHPLLRVQIPLPPMLHQLYYEDMRDRFMSKVVMSSEVPGISSLQNQNTSQVPNITTIYSFGLLAVTRLGDKEWTNLEPSEYYQFDDIIYHKNKFYAVTFHGEVYMYDIDRDQTKGTMITSIPTEKKDWVPCYLVESLAGSHIWVVLRFKETAAEPPIPGELEYYTSNFCVLKLELHYSDSNDAILSRTWTKQVKDLGNEALFIGRTSSTSIAASEFIKPNSIYFTDDNEDYFIARQGGGHDMRIFSVETSKIQIPTTFSRNIYPSILSITLVYLNLNN